MVGVFNGCEKHERASRYISHNECFMSLFQIPHLHATEKTTNEHLGNLQVTFFHDLGAVNAVGMLLLSREKSKVILCDNYLSNLSENSKLFTY